MMTVSLLGSGREYLAIDEVCERTGKSAAWVRQQEAAGRFPRRRSFGPRAGLYLAADVDAWIASQTETMTRLASVAGRPTQPLDLLVDTVVEVPIASRETKPVHVRVFGPRGARPQDKVVILGELNGFQPSLAHVLDTVLGYVDADLLGGNGVEALWIETTSMPIEDAAGWGRYWARNIFARRTSRGYSAPSLLPVSIADVDALIGRPLAWVPAEIYTAQTISRWQRAGTTVDIEYDTARVGALLDALQYVHDLPATSQHRTVANAVAPLLAREIRQRMIESAGHNDGTTPTTSDEAADWPTLFGARIVPMTLSARDAALLASYPSLGGTGAQRVDDASVAGLFAWRETVDEYATSPDQHACDHLDMIIETLQVTAPTPMTHALVFDLVGTWDRAYRDTLTHSPSPGTDRERRRLHRELAGWGIEDVRYGRDRAGHLVAHGVDAHGEEHVAVLWPTAPTGPLPRDGHLVADGAVGPRPVYIATGEEIVGLLPQSIPMPRQWNFGYPGSGPHDLADAITHYVATGLQIERASIPRAWILDHVTHSDQDHFDLALADILRRTTLDET